ncbi:MAG: hypothetical protein WA799_06760 [Nitrosotalea sp.]
MMEKKPQISQDDDFISSYADGFFIQSDEQTSTIRLVFYKNELDLEKGEEYPALPNETVKKLLFEVRLPMAAFNGLINIMIHFIRTKDELDKREWVSPNEKIYESLLTYANEIASSTFDTGEPQEHDKNLNAKFLYYLSKKQEDKKNRDEK